MLTEKLYYIVITAVANRGHKKKPMKHKKKKPMGKHKKKKQTFKDKLMPLLLIPFVIQTMLIPMFIMNLKMFALKAMAIGKIAILLIVFNMIRSWSQNSHSTSISGSTNGVIIIKVIQDKLFCTKTFIVLLI